jgi:hypothetical protein
LELIRNKVIPFPFAEIIADEDSIILISFDRL